MMMKTQLMSIFLLIWCNLCGDFINGCNGHVRTYSVTPMTRQRIFFPDGKDKRIKERFDNGTLNSKDFKMASTCFTESGQEGKCLLLQQCPELIGFVKSRGGIHTSGTINYLLQRQCRLLPRNIKLCCVLNATEQNTVTTTIQPTVQPTPAIPSKTYTLPSMDECGFRVASRITRGEDFPHGAHPWLVGVGYPRTDEAQFKVECGGTLITSRHVLTAAHCFHRDPRIRSLNLTHVILGEHSLSSSTERNVPEVIRITGVKDPGYNATSVYGDIALIVMEREITFSVFIRPACVPLPSQVKTFELEKEKLTVVGWGYLSGSASRGSDVPKEAQVSLVPKSQCRKAYDFAPHIPLDDTQVCFGDDGKDACRGDSGGPLLYREMNHLFRYFVVGLVSFGVGCGNTTYPGVYTYVPEYFTWIIDNLKS